jgi:hypothetical protein
MKENEKYEQQEKRTFFLLFISTLPVCLIFMNACSFSPSAISIFLMDRSYRQILMLGIIFEFFALTVIFLPFGTDENNESGCSKLLFRIF